MRKADRGIGKSESKTILQHIGVFVPVGSGKYTFSHTHFRAFLAVMADVTKQINTTILAVKTVSFRQDNAGCYHWRACRATTVCTAVLGAELGVVFKHLVPFPPHGRKGACDRKAGGG